MDEKYIEDLFTKLGGESKFGSFSDFKDLMQNDAQYRQDFHSSIGEKTLGKFGDFESLVKKNNGQVSQTGGQELQTGGQTTTSPAQSPSQSPSKSEEPKLETNISRKTGDWNVFQNEQPINSDGTPPIDENEPTDEVSLALKTRKYKNKVTEIVGSDFVSKHINSMGGQNRAFDVYYNKEKQSQYEQKLRDSGIDEKGQEQILTELKGIPDEIFEREFIIESGEKVKPYNTPFLGRLRKENYPYYINQVNSIKNDYNLEKEGDKKASNQLANAWNETGMSQFDNFNSTEPEAIVNNLNTLNNYTTKATGIITNASSKTATGFKTTDESLNNLKQSAGTYIESNVTPDTAKDYLSNKIDTNDLELKYNQQDLSSIISGQPVPKQDLDEYTLKSIKSKLDPNSVVDQMVFNVYSQKVALEDAFQSGTSIEDAAMNYRKFLDSEFNDQMNALEGNVNRSTRGETVDAFISDPAVLEYAKKDPELYAKLVVAKMKFNKDYPEFAKSKLLQKIGSVYQKEYANAFANNPTTDKLDIIVDKLLKEGQITEQDVNTYKTEIVPKQQWFWKTVRGLTAPVGGLEWFKSDIVPVGDLTYGLYEGVYGTLHRVAKSIEQGMRYSPGTGFIADQVFSDKAVIDRALADRTIAQVDPIGFAGTMYQVGEVTGFAATLGLMGIPAAAMGLSAEATHLITTALAFYGENKKEALLKIPGNTFADEVQRQLLTGSNLAIDLYLTKFLDINKISKNALSLLKRDVSDVIGKLRTGNITQAKAGEEVWGKIKDFGVRFGANSMKNAIVMNSFTAAHDAVKKLFNAGGKELPEIAEEYINNFIPTLKSTVLLNLFASVKPGERITVGKTLFDMAKNPEYYREMINKKYGDNPKLQAEKEDLLNNLDEVTSINNNYSDPIFKDLTEAQRQKILLLRMQANIYAKKATSTQDPTASKSFLDKSNDLSKQIETITKGKDKASEHEIKAPTTSPTESEKVATEAAPEMKQGESVADVEVYFNNFEKTIKDSEEILKQNPDDADANNAISEARIKLDALKKDPVKYFEDEKARVLEDLNKSLESGTPKEELAIDEVTAKYDNLIKQAKAYGEKNAAGVSGVVGEGQTSQQVQSVEGTGTEATGAGGVLQTPGVEGEGEGVGDKVGEKVTEPTDEQIQKDVKEKNFVSFTYDDESQVPEQFKDKISSTSVINGKKVVKVTLPKSVADYELAKAKEGVGEVKAEVPQQKLEEGTTIELPPQVKGGVPRQMIYKDGVWQQQVGGQVTKVGENVQKQAQAQFESSQSQQESVGVGKVVDLKNKKQVSDVFKNQSDATNKGELVTNDGEPIYEANVGIINNGLKTLTEKKWGHGSDRADNKSSLEILNNILGGQNFKGDFGKIGTEAYTANENGKFVITTDNPESINETKKLNPKEVEIILNDQLSPFGQALKNKHPEFTIKDYNGKEFKVQTEVTSKAEVPKQKGTAETKTEPVVTETKQAEAEPTAGVPEPIKIKSKTTDKLLKFANKHITEPIKKFSKKFVGGKNKEVLTSQENKESQIVDEMNSMDLVNHGIDLSSNLTTKEKIDVKELNSRLTTPLETVNWEQFEGIPFTFTISDQLRTGDVKNPNTGKIIKELSGGIGFNGTEGNENNAWANTTKEEAEAMLQKAKEVYENNKPLFEKLWKEGKLPDGHIPVAVVKMAESSIMSNEAVFRVAVENIETLPKENKKEALKALKSELERKLEQEKSDVERGTILKKNKETKEVVDTKTPYTENTRKQKVKKISQYNKILDKLKQGDYKDIVDFLKDVQDYSLPEKTLIANEILYAEPNPIGAKSKTPGKPTTLVSETLLKGLDESKRNLIHLGAITDLLTEPSMKNVPNMHIVSIVGVDVKNPEVTSVNHKNYQHGVKGKSIGILEQPVHMKDAFGEAYGSALAQVTKNEAQNASISEKAALTQGIPVQAGLPNRVFKSAIARGGLDAVDKLSGFLRQAFPSTTFFTSQEAWDEAMSDPTVKKELKDGEVVYAFTTDGNVFINPELKTTKATLHETGHIWTSFVKENNPALHQKGLDLVSGTKELQDAIKEYGDTELAREEALMELMSTKGESIVNAAQKAKFQEWLLSVYKYIAQTFKSLQGLTPEQIGDVTLDKFIEGMLADILAGKELTTKKVKGETKFSKEGAPQSDKLSDMVDIVKDLVEEGHDLNDITKIVTRALNDNSQATKDLISEAHKEATKPAGAAGGAAVPPTGETKKTAPEEDPEMTKMANAVNDAFVEGRFGTDVLDNIIAKLQDTDVAKIYDTVKGKIKSGIITAKEIRDKIITTKQGSEADQAVLMYDLADLKGKEAGLMNEMINESDPAKQAEIARKIMDVQNEMQDNALANRYLGRTASSIFRLRQLWVNREMDLATMEKQYMSSKGIKSLTPEQSKEIQEAYNQITETKAKLEKAKGEVDALIQENEKIKAENEKLKELKEQSAAKEKEDRNKKAAEKITASQERINKAKANLKNLRGDMNVGVNPRVAIEIGKIAAEKFYQGAVKLDVLVKEVLDDVKDIFPDWTENDVRDHLFPNLKNASKYFTEEKDYTSSKKELKDKINQYKALQSEYAKTLFEWQKERRTDLMDKRPWSEKLADRIYQWQRFAVLSYPTTFVKLAAVVGHNLLLKPFKFGYQKVIANIAKAISKDFAGKMGVYGDPSLKAMAKYYSEFIRNFSVANLKEQFSGIDTKEILYGDKFMYDEWSAGKGLLEMPGRSHGYIKSFVKNPEFQFAHEMLIGQSMTKMAEIGKKMEDPNLTPKELDALKEEYDKYDITNEDVLMRINKLSLEHGKDAILMGDNKTVDKFRELTKGSGAASTFLKTEAPIVKIPLNYINRALLTKYGLMQAITGKSFGSESTQHPSVAKLIFKGTKGLTEAQGQALSKALLYGSMGATMFALGYFNKDKVKLNEDGSIDLDGMHISKNLIHVPEFESFFSGAETAHKFKDEKSKLNWIQSFLLSDMEILKKNPFLNMLEYGLVGNLVNALTDKKMKDESKVKLLEDAATNKVINMAVPGFSKQMAQWMDTEEGKGVHPMGTPIKRKPQGDWGERFVQSLEMAIPGLRQLVPTGEGKKIFDEKQITESGILKRYQKLGVEFKEVPAADKLGTDEPLTPEQYDKFVEAYQKEIKLELLDLSEKQFEQKTETIIEGETETDVVEGTEGTNIGMLSKKFSEAELKKEKENKDYKKESALQNAVDEILSTAKSKVLVMLKHKKPTKSWQKEKEKK